MVSILVIGPKVRWLKWIFKGDKILQHAFRRTGSKAVGPCHKILPHVKELYEYERDIS
jgi:hypothetical protein